MLTAFALRRCLPLTCAAFLLVPCPRAAVAQTPDLVRLSLEELMDLEVTTVSRRAEPVATAAAAVTVITADEIRRAGATTLPEALRLAEGLHVARLDASKWAIASRGFSSQFVASLLVLIDGRSVYSPLFSGVLWETQDLLLDDVERIEVIRGPGATLWGANAVTGIINIVTQPAAQTRGGLVRAGAGTEERAFTALRYGGRAAGGDARVWLKAGDHDRSVTATGKGAADDWHHVRGGLRFDRGLGEEGEMTLLAGAHRVDVGETLGQDVVTPPYRQEADDERRYGGGFVQGRWHRAAAGGAASTVQVYAVTTDAEGGRRRAGGGFRERRRTLDLDAQHGFATRGRHRWMLGAGYRLTADRVHGDPDLYLDPARRTDHLFSAFVQDEVRLRDDRVRVSAGTKWEHNAYSGTEWQPGLRLLVRAAPRHSVWAAVSRAVRMPTRIEHDGGVLGGVRAPGERPNPLDVPLRLQLIGDGGMASEKLVAWELGYRGEPGRRLLVDIAAFHHAHDDLRTAEPAGLPRADSTEGVPHATLNLHADNRMEGTARGVELRLRARPTPRWQLTATWAWLDLDLRLDADSHDPISILAEGDSPEHRGALRSDLDLPGGVTWSAEARWIDELESGMVDAFLELDSVLGWEPRSDLRLSLVGRNLLHDRHLEFRRQALVNTQSRWVQREVYLAAAWTFASR